MNAMGKPIRAWDSRDHVIRSVYDDLHRRIELWVKVGSADEVLAEQTIYGEGQTDPEVSNLRGKVYQVKDGAGVLTNVSYDFKGNLLSSQRQLAVAYSTQLDWSDTVTLETETFVQTTVYDALNRPTSITMPDSSEILPIYNEAGLLESVTAHVRGAIGLTTFVDDIDYDAKGQREKIVYGNGVYTEYTYDPETYRVKRIKTTRDSDDEILQDLRYTYDAVGNIVEVADLAHETFYHGGHEIKAVWQYEYDALYRLTYATGREHVGTNDDIQQDANGFPLVNGANPNDPSAMRNYEEWFEYDQVGNILKMIHDAQSSVGDWTRHYHVAETSNRLLDTSLPGDDEEDAVYSAEYTHDAHGNMLTMPHLDGIEWDFKDQMRHVDKGGGGDVYFVYDASGQRIRKVWEHSGIIEERIYLGGFELYRRHEMGDVVLERETLHIMDDAQRIAMVETKTIDEAADPFTITPRIRYQCSNHLGSAMLELDDEGLVISYEEYHPYGTSAYRAVDDSIEVSTKRYRYTGKERDEETGLYYHGARYYACWLARWTAADPAGMVDGVNLFQYVRGRPLHLIDPDGTASKDAAKESHAAHLYKVGLQATTVLQKAEKLYTTAVNEYNVIKDRYPVGSDERRSQLQKVAKYARVMARARRSQRVAAEEVAKDLKAHVRFDHDKATRHIANLLQASWNAGVTDRAQVAYIIATADHESLMGKSMIESEKQAKAKGYDLKYRGRGYGHLTDEKEKQGPGSNYTRFGRIFGVDLVNNPDLAAGETLAAKILVNMLTQNPARSVVRSGKRDLKKLADFGVKEGESAKNVAIGWEEARAMHNVMTPGERKDAKLIKDVAKKIFKELGGVYGQK